MRILHGLKSLIQNLFSRTHRDQDADDELHSYVRLLAEEKIRAGRDTRTAWREARAEMGSTESVKEKIRSNRLGHSVDTVLQDLRHGLRMLRRNPGFTTVAVITLALGIGANTAIFSVVNAAVLRPLPYGAPDELVHLWETSPQRVLRMSEASHPTYIDWSAQNNTFDGLAGYNSPSFTLTGRGMAERVDGMRVTPNFFSVLDVDMHLGHGFRPAPDREAPEPEVVVTYAFWQRLLGEDPAVLGQSLSLDGTPFNVVGVLPPDFHFALAGPGENPEVWMPLLLSEGEATRREFHWLRVVGRLKPDVGIERAEADLNTIHRRLEQQYPDAYAERQVRVVPLRGQILGPVRNVLLLLMGAVGLVLLIACANVASLMLVRSASRNKELALRVALGANRSRIVRQLLTESLTLSGIGAGVGLLLSSQAVRFLLGTIPETMYYSMPYLSDVRADGMTLAFTAAVLLLTTILFGLGPALRVSRVDLNRTLKEGGDCRRATHRVPLGRVLVSGELALTFLLLLASGLLIQSMHRLLSVDPGFDTANLLTFRVALPPDKYEEDARIRLFHEEFSRRLDTLPGVAAHTMNSKLPLSGAGNTLRFVVEGTPRPPAGQEPDANLRVIPTGYFFKMGIPWIGGPGFDGRDGPESPLVGIVNQAFVRQYMPEGEAVGSRLLFPSFNESLTIVGVVGDAKVGFLDQPDLPILYISASQSPLQRGYYLVRLETDAASVLPMIRTELRAIDPDVPLGRVTMMGKMVEDSQPVFLRRFLMQLFGLSSVLALVLALVGVYGVLSYSINQRTQEIGIRMALGARPGDVVRMVLGQGVLLAVAGLVLGVSAALALGRLLERFLYGLEATDPVTILAASLFLVVVAMMACYVPARRATRVDPMVALRYE